MIKISSLSGAVSDAADEAYEWLLGCVSAATCAAEAWPLDAGFAALRPHIGQVAPAEQAEGLAETKRQPVTKTVCSCVCGWDGEHRTQLHEWKTRQVLFKIDRMGKKLINCT